MKIGIIISAVILVIFGLIGFFAFMGVADSPTFATSGKVLAKSELPADLPTVYSPARAGDSANAAYAKAFAFYRSNERELSNDNPAVGKTEQLMTLLIDAMDAGQVNRPFLDDGFELKPGAQSSYGAAIESVPELVLTHAHALYEKGRDKERAVRAAKATFAMGHRAFHHSELLWNRYQGLHAMLFATQVLSSMGEENEKLVSPYFQPINDMIAKWEKKLMLIRNPDPQIGNLVNIAENDEDPTFRIEAVLYLGSAKYRPGGRGNYRAIMAAIQDAQQSDNATLAQAAKNAEAMTLAERRQMK